jgi:hypothetical protein
MDNSSLTKVLLAAGLVCNSFLLMAQEAKPDSAASKNWTFTAGLDAYSAFNTNRPPDSVNELRNFDLNSGSAHLNAASLGIEYKSDYFGAHFDGGYGDMFKTIAATDAWKGPNQYVMQGYISILPWKQNGLQIDIGKFYSSIGAEVPDTLSNFNYSRSLAFTLGSPYDHFGLRTSLPVTKTLTAGLQLVDGCNDVTDRNKGRMAILTTAVTHSKWGWNQAFMTGRENAPGLDTAVAAYRNVLDEVVTFAPNSSVHAYSEGLYGREHRTGFAADNWYAVAAAMKWDATKKLAFSPRLEFFGDPAGFNSGTPQHLHEFTATAEYKIHPLLTARFEYRRDMSDEPVFSGRNGMSRSQQTLLVGLIAAWKSER